MLVQGSALLLIVLYSGLVVGTYKKLRSDQILFPKRVILILPFMIFALHTTWFLTQIFKDRKKAFVVLELGFLKYPMVIGLLAEVYKENLARTIGESSKMRIKKQRQRKREITKRIEKAQQDMNNRKGKAVIDDYKKTIFASVS
ncbi:hypothetical protein [Pontibacillus salipaludis]|uniref:hypothetical protein n=1 Tax=Pontibacillus salipaludis TaxID=1697394 RepID=UPI0031E817EC